MRFKMNAAQLADNPQVKDILFIKMLEKVDWGPKDFSRVQIQYCLNNDVVLNNLVLYSPVLQETTLNTSVPLTWKDSCTRDEDGKIVDRFTYSEYLRTTEVTGGTVLQFAGGKKDSNDNITWASFAQIKEQVQMAGGFLTQAEVDLIKIVQEEELQ